MLTNDIQSQRDNLDEALADISNLIAALQVVCWHLCGMSLEKGTELDELRNAVIGIGNALEERAAKV